VLGYQVNEFRGEKKKKAGGTATHARKRDRLVEAKGIRLGENGIRVQGWINTRNGAGHGGGWKIQEGNSRITEKTDKSSTTAKAMRNMGRKLEDDC